MDVELKDRVIQFMIDNRVDCVETIYQTDRVIESAYEFIEDLYHIVKEDLNPIIAPPTYEEVLTDLKSSGAEIGEFNHGGDGTVWVVVKSGGISVDLYKHEYYSKSDRQKLTFLRLLKELLNIE